MTQFFNGHREGTFSQERPPFLENCGSVFVVWERSDLSGYLDKRVGILVDSRGDLGA